MLDRCRRAMALGLAFATLSLLGAPPALAGEAAILAGKVFRADGVTPRPGVVVHLVDPGTEREYPSAPTRDDGAFRVEGAPAGTYRVLAETSDGAFLAGAPLTVAAGANRPVSLTLAGAAPAFQSSADPTATSGPGSEWGRWAIAGGIVIAALFVINEVTDDQDQPASPS